MFYTVFLSQPAQICEICVEAALFEVLMSVTCLRHVTRLFSSPHNEYLTLLHEECEMHRININAYSQIFRLSNIGCWDVFLVKK